jgi:large subunit ribosomal protein L2
MGIKKYKPTTPGLRMRVGDDFTQINKKKPNKKLTRSIKKSGGRNNAGRICVRRRGGGHKRRYRKIDFKRDKYDMSATVISIEYDPNRNAYIALLEYQDKEKRYIIYPKGLKVGDKVISSSTGRTEIQPGNCMKLSEMPLGTMVHNIELNPGRGGVLARSAGSIVQLMAKEKGFAQLKLPSGEIRMVKIDCRATVGQVGNITYSSQVFAKAGRMRWLGKRPKVRGVAMNPVDHPHGGGEGRAGQGNPHPVTPWGQPTKGFKTRKRKKSDRYITKRRSIKKRRRG